jgi:hypothetical protein
MLYITTILTVRELTVLEGEERTMRYGLYST